MHEYLVDKRYVVMRSLGMGGMGEVYLAHDEVLGRDVALKMLSGRYAGDEGLAERFRREALSAASLSHPNIVQVYDRGETEDATPYIAMEYVPGGTLQEQIEERGPFEAREAVAVAAQIAEALWAAHEHGVIHCDIKPQNVLMGSSGDLKVTDFGIAKAASAVTGSVSGAVFGTAGYISPEQALGEPVGPASDLYSLGVVLYEMLTGELPFTADNSIAVCMKHVTEPPRPPRELNPAIPAEMDALVVKLLAKNPADRYAGAGELLADLERQRDSLLPVFGAETTTQPLRTGPQAAARLGAGRAARTLAVGAVVILLALLGTVIPTLLQAGEGRELLPRTKEVAHGFIAAPSEAAAKTDAGATGQTGATLGIPAASSAAPPPGAPVVPIAPPPEDTIQTPSRSQYDGGGN